MESTERKLRAAALEAVTVERVRRKSAPVPTREPATPCGSANCRARFGTAPSSVAAVMSGATREEAIFALRKRRAFLKQRSERKLATGAGRTALFRGRLGKDLRFLYLLVAQAQAN